LGNHSFYVQNEWKKKSLLVKIDLEKAYDR